MGQYRRPDQYYIDQYDRITIERLKELERRLQEAVKNSALEEHSGPDISGMDVFGVKMAYVAEGVNLARNRRGMIDSWMQADERKDRLLLSHVVPAGVTCNTCDGPMRFELHDFVGEHAELIFFFSCPKGHKPKKALYADGRERHFSPRICSYCGGELLSKTKKSGHQMTITDTCSVCDKTEVFEYDATPKKILPVDEGERKKYCTDFSERRSFEEDLQAIADLSKILNEQEVKVKYDCSKVQQLNIAQLEQTLTERIEKAGFIKMQFDKPKTGRYLTVEFSAQDPADRDGPKSIKALKGTIETALFPTNWRLMSPGIDYKLGFLSGQLKGFSLDEYLLKIAQEIAEKGRG